MARYIDVEKAKNDLDLLTNGITLGFGPIDESLKSEIQKVFDSEVNKWKEFKEYLSACEKDAMEVVRCKDCKFYHTQDCAMDDWHFSETKDGDFCSYGKRKDEDV